MLIIAVAIVLIIANPIRCGRICMCLVRGEVVGYRVWVGRWVVSRCCVGRMGKDIKETKKKRRCTS